MYVLLYTIDPVMQKKLCNLIRFALQIGSAAAYTVRIHGQIVWWYWDISSRNVFMSIWRSAL